MLADFLVILIFIGILVGGFMWYLLGRAICLLLLNDFEWKHFVEDWKDFEGEPAVETLLFMIFPLTVLYIWLNKI